jgi:hypothetical protein
MRGIRGWILGLGIEERKKERACELVSSVRSTMLVVRWQMMTSIVVSPDRAFLAHKKKTCHTGGVSPVR